VFSGRGLEQPRGVGPGQQFAELGLRMACDDAGDGVGEEGLRVDAVEPPRLVAYRVDASVLGELSSVALASRTAERSVFSTLRVAIYAVFSSSAVSNVRRWFLQRPHK
jgi:hypothetical protein